MHLIIERILWSIPLTIILSMNKISHLVNSNIFNTTNQNCVIINPIQTFQKKKLQNMTNKK